MPKLTVKQWDHPRTKRIVTMLLHTTRSHTEIAASVGTTRQWVSFVASRLRDVAVPVRQQGKNHRGKRSRA